MMKKKIYMWIGLMAVLVLSVTMFLKPTSQTIMAKPVLVVSIQPQKYLLEKIVGDHYQVICLMEQGANPESFEPSMANLMKLEKCQAYFCMGNLGFETAVLERIKSSNPKLIIIDNSSEIELLRGTHSGVHSHKHCCGNEVDPHVWTSVRNAENIVQSMYKSLIELDPDNNVEYTRNYNAILAELYRLDDEFTAQLAPFKGTAFAVWHPSLSYFAHDYGLTQIAMENEGKEVSASALKQEIDLAREKNVKVLFYQKEFDSRQVQTIGSQLDVDMVEISPMSYDWTAEMKKIANAISSSK